MAQAIAPDRCVQAETRQGHHGEPVAEEFQFPQPVRVVAPDGGVIFRGGAGLLDGLSVDPPAATSPADAAGRAVALAGAFSVDCRGAAPGGFAAGVNFGFVPAGAVAGAPAALPAAAGVLVGARTGAASGAVTGSPGVATSNALSSDTGAAAAGDAASFFRGTSTIIRFDLLTAIAGAVANPAPAAAPAPATAGSASSINS